nr:hypothetical protein [Tanacetum cinerariifolium]
MANNLFISAIQEDDMPILDEVVFKIHQNGFFEFDPLRYVDGPVSSVAAFTCDRVVFPTCLDWILSEISGKNGLCSILYQTNHLNKVEEDDAMSCSSSTPFSTVIKRKGGNITKEGLRKKVKPGMVDDEPVGRKSIQTSRKGKEKIYELLENVDVGIKQDVRTRTNVLALMAPGNLQKNLSYRQQRVRAQL